MTIQVGSSVWLVSFGDDTPPTRLESRCPPFETTVLALEPDDGSLRIALSSDDGYGWWVESNQVEEISEEKSADVLNGGDIL